MLTAWPTKGAERACTLDGARRLATSPARRPATLDAIVKDVSIGEAVWTQQRSSSAWTLACPNPVVVGGSTRSASVTEDAV